MKTILYFIIWIHSFLFCVTLSAQDSIEGSLLNLASLTLDRSPIVQQNKLLINQAEASYRSQKSIFDYELSSGFNLSRNNKYRIFKYL